MVLPKRTSIQVVTWNSLKFLSDCLESIFNQNYQDFSVLIIDNASTDGTIKFIEQNYPQIKIIRNSKNLGFARAHNQGILMTKSEYILVMNPDIILEPDFLKKIVNLADKNKRISSFGGKLLKIKLGDLELAEKIKTTIIDSAGLKIFKSRRIIDRGEGEKDKGQYDRQEKIFGISGACVLYRRTALEDVKIPVNYKKNTKLQKNDSQLVALQDIRRLASHWEYLDNDFFAYKEDIDLAWRLQLCGWQALYAPEAKAYHFRSASVVRRFSKSSWVNFFSYRNHLWMLLKNDYWQNFFLYGWFIFWYQLSKEIYLFFTQPKILFRAGYSFWRNYKKMIQKRRYILKRAQVKAKRIRQWMK